MGYKEAIDQNENIPEIVAVEGEDEDGKKKLQLRKIANKSGENPIKIG